MSWSINAVGSKEELKAKLSEQRVIRKPVEVLRAVEGVTLEDVEERGVAATETVTEEQEFDNDHLPDGLRAILSEAVDKIEGERILLQASGHFDANTCQGSFIVQKV